MKFSKFILAVAASFLILSQAGAATIVGNLMDIYGGGIDRTIKISPKSTPQAVIYNGTNYTVMDLAKTVSSTNSIFAVVLLGGIYNVDFGTVNGVATPVTKILVPPYDTNTYSFNYVANLATNLGTFVWTNSYGIAAGTNIVITTNGALLVINSAGAGTIYATNVSGLGTAAYSNATAFAASSVTNLTSGQLSTIAAAITNGQTGANLGYTVFTNSKYQALGAAPNSIYLNAGAGFNTANNFLGNTNYPEAQNTNMGIVFSPVVDNDNYLGATNSLGNIPRFLKFWWRYQDDIRYNTNLAGAPSAASLFKISKDLSGNGNDYVEAYNDLMVDRDLRVDRAAYIATNGSTYVGNLTIKSNAIVNGIIANDSGDLNISQNLGGNTGRNINIQADDSLDSSAGGVTILGGNASDSNGGGILIKAGNGTSIGGDVTISTGTNSTAPNTANSISLKSYSVGYGISGQIDIAGSTIFSSNVYFGSNLYVTNHAYDVSTSRLDPLANEFVTAEYVQSVMAANFDLYFSTNSSGISITNVGTPSTMVLVNPTTSQTNTISSLTNGTYFTARLQTNSISYIQSVPINLYTYVQVTGGGSVTAHPEMWLYNTNGTIVQLGYSSDNTYNSDIAVPVNLAIALTNTAYLNVNLTNSPKLLLRWYVTSTSGNPTWKFLIGAGNVSHITVGTIPSANQNYVGTFTGNGSGLTNIPATGIVGTAVTNNASPTLTGLSVGAQTALDVNGNGKVGGVGHTNGVLTGNGSGLTNINSTAVVATNMITWIDPSQFMDAWTTYFLRATSSNPPQYISSGISFYLWPQYTYQGPLFRLTPYQTAGYTNFAATVYIIATNTTYISQLALYIRAAEIESTNNIYLLKVDSAAGGTFTNGNNIRTIRLGISPSFKNKNFMIHGGVSTDTAQFTNQVWVQNIKIEAY